MINQIDYQNKKAFTLMEVLVALTVLLVGITGTIAAINSSMILDQTSREKAIAVNAARAKLEEIYSFAPFEKAFEHYSTNKTFNIDPGGGKNSPLTPIAAGAPLGRVEFPTVDDQLSEAIASVDWQMPRDLNGNGDAADIDVSSDYKLLPVQIVVEWRNRYGPQQYTVFSMISSHD